MKYLIAICSFIFFFNNYTFVEASETQDKIVDLICTDTEVVPKFTTNFEFPTVKIKNKLFGKDTAARYRQAKFGDRYIKKLYGYKCVICDFVLVSGEGGYSHKLRQPRDSIESADSKMMDWKIRAYDTVYAGKYKLINGYFDNIDGKGFAVYKRVDSNTKVYAPKTKIGGTFQVSFTCQKAEKLF